MDFARKFLEFRIDTKIRLLHLLICCAFLLILAVIFFTFVTLRNLSHEITSQDTEKIITGSQITRRLSSTFSKVDILSTTFYEKDSYLESEGNEIIAVTQNIAATATDLDLKMSLTRLTTHIDSFLSQCVLVNKVLHARNNINLQTHQELSQLEELLGNLLIKATLQGDDASYIEQLLMLTVGYRESILQTSNLQVEKSYEHFFIPLEEKTCPFLASFDDILLRLQTITASGPDVARQGIKIIENVRKFRETSVLLHDVMMELDRRKTDLKNSKMLSMLVMGAAEKKIYESTQLISGRIDELIFYSGICILTLSLFVMGFLTFAISYLIRSSIREPMMAILSGIESFKNNQLETQVALGRKDEWDDIEKGLNNMASNLTETYQTIQENEERLHNLLQCIQVGIVVHTPDTTIIICNKASQDLLGFTEEELLGKDMFDPAWKFYHEDGSIMSFESYPVNQVINQKDMVKNYALGISRYGESKVIWVLVNAVPEFAPDGNISRVTVTFVNITERRQIEKALYESKIIFNSFLEHSPIHIFIKDSEIRSVMLSKNYEQMFGMPLENILGKTMDEVFPADLAKRIIEDDKQVLREGKAQTIFEELAERTYETTKFPIFFEGKASMLAGFTLDVTERLQNEEKLKNFAKIQAVLLREVNHRVKNNLTAIIGMLHQEQESLEQRSFSDTKTNLKDIIGRIEGLLTIHSLLSGNKWKPLTLSSICWEIIQGATQPTSTANSIDLQVTDSNVHVDSDQAHYLAIIFNELATNSIKYARNTNDDKTHVQISIDSDNSSIRLVYHDDGPGYPDSVLHGEVSKDHIGFYLIRGIVKKSLQGDIELVNDNGAMVRITFPLMVSESENRGSTDE